MPSIITRINDLLSFGDIGSCAAQSENAFVHGCKEPCHRRAVGYTQKSLDKNHPHYLAFEQGRHLYLNLIDPPLPLFQLESFKIFLAFMETQKQENRAVHIHCNKGESRAPSLALLAMVKNGLLPAESYEAARQAFERQYLYKPGEGIARFLTQNWDRL